MRVLTTLFFLFLSINCIDAQTTIKELYSDLNKTGSVYYAYPTASIKETPAPEGYEPFYISHYGRHGSRYLISDKDYNTYVQLLGKADSLGILTVKGKEVLKKLIIIAKDAEGQGGELTPLGFQQHQNIANRMFHRFPEVFKHRKQINACSTVVIRCALSMAKFCETLKGLDPHLDIHLGSGERYMQYLNFWNEEACAFTSSSSTWRKDFEAFKKKQIQPDRLIHSLISDQAFINNHIENKNDFMMGMYWIASDLQNVKLDLSLYDIFEKKELVDIWQVINYEHYMQSGAHPLSTKPILQTYIPLMNNILESADKAIKGGHIAANLRFGHDGNVMPLVSFLAFESFCNKETNPELFYKAWSDFKVVPMAANVQLIFYRHKTNKDIIVKFLLNENEVNIPINSNQKPYYHWADVKQFYKKKIQSLR